MLADFLLVVHFSIAAFIVLGLILVWSGILLLVMQVVMHRPRRARRRSAYDDRIDEWYDNDVHRPGYAGRTEALPTVRGDRRR